MGKIKNGLQKPNAVGGFVFDPELLDKIKGNSPVYSIGVDTCDKKSLAYCLCKRLDGRVEILLAKTIRNEKLFKQEVTNLSKYFNAKVYEEV